MAIVDQELKWGEAILCQCPNEIVIEVKDSAFLTPAGKFLRAKIINITGAADIPADTTFEIQYDDASLTTPEAGIQACDIENICCMDCTDRYLESLIEALDARVAALEV